MKTYFDHERLNVYQEAIAFCGWVGDLLNQITAKAAAKDQLDRASTSIPLNIDVLGARKLIGPERIFPAKEQLVRIVNMLVGTLKRFSEHAGSLREEEGVYRVEQEHDQEQESK